MERVGPAVHSLAHWMDDAFLIPGTTRRVGVDGVVGLIPGVGDALGFAASSVVVVAGAWAGVSVPTLLRMVLNVAMESVVGVIPLVGDAFDFAWKSNTRNLRLIEADLADQAGTRRSSIAVLVLVLLAVLLLVALAAFVTVLLGYVVVRTLRVAF